MAHVGAINIRVVPSILTRRQALDELVDLFDKDPAVLAGNEYLLADLVLQRLKVVTVEPSEKEWAVCDGSGGTCGFTCYVCS